MSSRELRTLVAIADHGSITAAAEVLFLSVPAVSAHVLNLEREFRSILMDRKRKPARLNQIGQAMAKRGREILRLYDQLHETASGSENLSGILTLGTSPTVLTKIIPQALLSLRASHPQLQIRMRYGHPLLFMDQIRHGEIDAAILSEQKASVSGMYWTKFAREPIMVIAPPHARGRTDETLLREFPYIRFGQKFLISHDIAEHLSQRRLNLQEVMDVESIEAIKLMVHHGLGVSIIPESNASLSRYYGLRCAPFGKPGMKRNIGLAQAHDTPKQQLILALYETLKSSSQAERGRPTDRPRPHPRTPQHR